MNAKILVFAICVETIMCLLLSNLNDCAFKTPLLSTNVTTVGVDVVIKYMILTHNERCVIMQHIV